MLCRTSWCHFMKSERKLYVDIVLIFLLNFLLTLVFISCSLFWFHCWHKAFCFQCCIQGKWEMGCFLKLSSLNSLNSKLLPNWFYTFLGILTNVTSENFQIPCGPECSIWCLELHVFLNRYYSTINSKYLVFMFLLLQPNEQHTAYIHVHC